MLESKVTPVLLPARSTSVMEGTPPPSCSTTCPFWALLPRSFACPLALATSFPFLMNLTWALLPLVSHLTVYSPAGMVVPFSCASW